MILFALEVLRRCGILENSKRWEDYEKAIRFINENYSVSPEEYKSLIETIADFIGV